MGIGPTLTCSQTLFEDLPRVLREHDIRCATLPPKIPGEIRLRLSRRVGAAEVYCKRRDGAVSLWLVCAHGLNPVLWWPECRLVDRVDAIVREHGAVPCTFNEFAESS